MDFRRTLTNGWNYLTSSTSADPPHAQSDYASSSTSNSDDDSDMSTYFPTYADLCVVRAMLNSFGLPTELALQVLDYAQYEPVLQFISAERQSATAMIGTSSSSKVCLDAGIMSNDTIRSLCARTTHPQVKKVEFEICSHDQGWTTERTTGTFDTSSWVEVSIFRSLEGQPEKPPNRRLYNGLGSPHDLQQKLEARGQTLATRPVEAERGAQGGEPPLAWYLQANRVADRKHPTYRVLWAPDCHEGNEGAGEGEGFLETLQAGDRILVWARAKYPGWQCTVDSVAMTVHYNFETAA